MTCIKIIAQLWTLHNNNCGGDDDEKRAWCEQLWDLIENGKSIAKRWVQGSSKKSGYCDYGIMKSSQLFSGLGLIIALLVFGEGMLLGCGF